MKITKTFGRPLWQISPLAPLLKRPYFLLLLLILVPNVLMYCYDTNKNISVQMAHWTWYLDWRFWPEWMTKICWLMPWWALVIVLINIVFSPQSKRFYLRPRLYRWIAHFALLYFIDSIWRTETKTPLSFYMNIISHLYKNHTLAFPIVIGVLLFVVFGTILWKFWRRRKLTKADHVSAVVLFLVIALLGSTISPTVYSQTPNSKPVTNKPTVVHQSGTTGTSNTTKSSATGKPIESSLSKKTTTSSTVTKPKATAPTKVTPPKPKPVYKYKIKSREELERLTPQQIKELVAEENRFERRGDKMQLEGPMVHLFDEKEFVYNGGKYQNATIKYRLLSPLKTIPNKKYPLVIYLHGVGEAGNDNAYPLLYLNNLLPLMIGPDKEDFFMLVLQCPKENKGWNFISTKDGTLNVLDTLVDKLIGELPIEPRQLSLFGLSSGGSGIWLLLQRYPEKFAAACPAPGIPPAIKYNFRQLTQTRIWTFRGKSDGATPAKPILQTNDFLNKSGGFGKLTELDKVGHDAWSYALGRHDCIRWMINQKQGSWFAPLPERESFKTWSVSESWQKFLMPLAIAVCLLLISGMPLFQNGCTYFQRRVLRYGPKLNEVDQNEKEQSADPQSEEKDQPVESEEGEISQSKETPSMDNSPGENPESASDDADYRIWTDPSGSRRIKARLIGFEKGLVVIELANGKRIPTKSQAFSKEDIEYLKEKWVEFKEKQQE